MKEQGVLRKFNDWVSKHYKGRYMDQPPKDWDRRSEMYWKIGNLQYGPIRTDDVPKEFL